jgi:hypothetical protein
MKRKKSKKYWLGVVLWTSLVLAVNVGMLVLWKEDIGKCFICSKDICQTPEQCWPWKIALIVVIIIITAFFLVYDARKRKHTTDNHNDKDA